MGERNSHCSWCGAALAPDQPWPRTCAACGKRSYLNPRPVAVLVVPVGAGVLLVQRGIPPQQGAWALPGGYIGLGETWEAAGAREVQEETGLRLDPAAIRHLCTLTDAEGGYLLVFGVAAPQPATALAEFTPNAETLGWGRVTGPQALAFPLHTQALATYFADRRT